MTGKAGAKAGLVGAAVLIVITVIQRLLRISGGWVYAACGITSLIYVATGILAGRLLNPRRTSGKGAGAGAIAGLISGGLSSIVGAAIMLVQMSQGLGIPGLDPQQMEQLAQSGMDPNTLVTIGAVCGLGGGLLIGTGLGAAGGAVFASLRPD